VTAAEREARPPDKDGGGARPDEDGRRTDHLQAAAEQLTDTVPPGCAVRCGERWSR